jgi:hypothetical protein
VGLDGMMNVALPSGAVVYGPDFGYYQMELLPTQPCADLRALLLSEFVSFFYLLAYLSDFLCVSVCRRCLSVLDRYTSIGRSSNLQGLAAPSVSNKESTRRVNRVYSGGGGLLFVLYPY